MLLKKTMLLLILCISCICSFGQYKIGNISIDSISFSKYINDCYLHPDKIELESKYGIPNEWGEEQNRIITSRNDEIIRQAISCDNWYCLVPRKPTEQDFIKWKFKQAHK